MKKQILPWLFITLVACESNDMPLIDNHSVETVAFESVRLILPALEGVTETVRWQVVSAATPLYALVEMETAEPYFLAQGAGEYVLRAYFGTKTVDCVVRVKATNEQITPYITHVLDYNPAPGQFVHIFPRQEVGDTQEDMRKKAEATLKGEVGSDLISLGSFGGSVTFGFDHTIVNVKGKADFVVMGNAAIKGSSEPGVIEVAYDWNKNGFPDAEEWVEIHGESHSSAQSIRGYSITYHKPSVESAEANAHYIRWQDNQGGKGYLAKTVFHTQCYFPFWIDGETMTLTGTRLPDNATAPTAEVNKWVLADLGWGYVDSKPNKDPLVGIDIDWARNTEGEAALLPGVDFVRVYTGVNQQCGSIGEVSTEISGAYDLHLITQD